MKIVKLEVATATTPVRSSKSKQLCLATVMTLCLFGVGEAYCDVVTDWNAIMETTVSNVDPFLQVRSAAITQVAVFEAVNSILAEYEPYTGAISAPRGASPEAAAIAAAHRALTMLHLDSAATLDSLRTTALAAVPGGRAKEDGITVGIAAADAILALRADDGSNVEVPYTPGTRNGDWQPTPPDFAPAFRPSMGEVDTFVIEHGAQFRLGPPPALNSAAYTRDYDEVRTLGAVNSSERSQYRTDVARFYEVTDALPIYNPAARQVSEAQGKSLSQNARIFALLNMAIFDAAVAAFDTKYVYNYWRPVTAIQSAGTDGNRNTAADPNWQALVYSPPFPGYPSGHAAFGAAARRVLEHVFGKHGHAITLSNPLVPNIVLRYRSWKEIADDIDDARVYGGVHFRFDQTAAARQGKRIGTYVLRHALQPVRCHDGKW